jgi:Na+/melibiose symporter-like transporter
MKKISYALLAFPLSCLGIPLYLHLASFYFNNYQISLSVIGVAIFICRAFDCLFDPLSGFISDCLIARKVKRVSIILIFTVPLLINFYFLFNPFYKDKEHLIYWFGGNLLLLYFALSFVVVNYEAMVSDFEEKKNEFIAAREFMQILGILVISILPTIISKKYHISYDQSLSYLWIFILPFFGLANFLLYKNYINLKIPRLKISKISSNLNKLKKLFFIYFLNSIAVSIPAVSIRFYVDNYLKVSDLNGYFLGLYFLSAAISVIIWSKIIKKIGAKIAWEKSILLSVIIFIFAIFISEKNYYLFFAICILSGFAAGCDLTAPQILLVDKIKDEENKTSYFAVFSFITKISLAFATFLVLNLINQNGAINYIAIPYVYALLPCFLKILTMLFLKKL